MELFVPLAAASKPKGVSCIFFIVDALDKLPPWNKVLEYLVNGMPE
jgi:hypothetical protein